MTAIRNAKSSLLVSLSVMQLNSTLTSSASTNHLRRTLQALPYAPSDSSKPKRGKAKKEESDSPKKTKKQKEEEEQAEIYRWWEQQNQDNTVKWTTLEHSGVIFPPPYEPLPKDVKMKYNGTLPPCVLRLFFDSSQANPSTYPSRPRRSPASMLHS